MGKVSSKKSTERRQKPRTRKSAKAKEASTPLAEQRGNPGARPGANPEDSCGHCSQDLRSAERALLVEEELGRVFCSEECISAYFAPEIARLEKQYFKNLSPNDLSGEEREKHAHLRWLTLEEPDEVWREKTLAGDFRYTLVSEFQPGAKSIWCVCICLFLRGEPSFLYLAFPTKNAAMVNLYRRGERVEWASVKGSGGGKSSKKPSDPNDSDASKEKAPLIDGLAADGWSAEETLRAENSGHRSKNDIPAGDFENYHDCVDGTLEAPDEVWSTQAEAEGEESVRTYCFIKHFPDEKPGIWYVIIARETEDPEQIEILDAFPTRERQFMERFRRGEQEIGADEAPSPSRLVH